MVLRAKRFSGLGRATLSDVRIRFTRVVTCALERPTIVVFLFALAVRLGMAVVTGLWWKVSFLDDGAPGHMVVAPPSAEVGFFGVESLNLPGPLDPLRDLITGAPFLGSALSAIAGAVTAACVTVLVVRYVVPAVALGAGLLAGLIPSQVVLSSLPVKDPFVWMSLALIAVGVSRWNRSGFRSRAALQIALVLICLPFLSLPAFIVVAGALVILTALSPVLRQVSLVGAVVLLPLLIFVGISISNGRVNSLVAHDVIGAETELQATLAQCQSCHWAPGGDGVVVVTEALPQARTGESYRAVLRAMGGIAPYTWGLSRDPLPSGLNLAENGVVSGTANSESDTSLIFRVADAKGRFTYSVDVDLAICGFETTGDRCEEIGALSGLNESRRRSEVWSAAVVDGTQPGDLHLDRRCEGPFDPERQAEEEAARFRFGTYRYQIVCVQGMWVPNPGGDRMLRARDMDPENFEPIIALRESLDEASSRSAFDRVVDLLGGLRVLALGPPPSIGSALSLESVANIEFLLWYPMLLLATAGLFSIRRSNTELVFTLLVGLGLIVSFSSVDQGLVENFRYRGVFMWATIVFAAIGANRLMKTQLGFHRSRPESE